MRPKVYIETTVVSYVVAWPSRDIVVAAHQQLTREWWLKRNEFDLYISEAVLEEAARGDQDAAARRLEALAPIPLLQAGLEASSLAERLLAEGIMPPVAVVDATHVAIAATNGMNYLLTWNLKHIAAASARNRIEQLCRDLGYDPPIICTPEELLER